MAEARVLKILLGDVPVGHLTGFQDGKTLFAFDDSYIDLGPGRPTLSLSFNAPGDEEVTERSLREVHSSRMKLPPFFSNLLPEGVLRDYMFKRLKIHHDHEFELLMALGASLPGAVRALPADDFPQSAIISRPAATHASRDEAPIKFSLGGSQLKFSMIERGGRFSLADGDDEWIVKPPHPTHANVPANEYAMMRMAAAAGIQTPEVKLVKLDDVDLGGLAGLAMPQSETQAYAVKRYDRTAAGRVHVEDFAQVFNVHADQEYKATNYDTIGRLIFDLFPDRFDQIAEFVRRLVVNILIGNGDAHLKNWSVIYLDKVTPRLAPAYDLVSTIHYVPNDSLALNLGGEKRFESIDESHFDRLARRMEAPPKFVLETVKETVATARKKWPAIIREAGLPDKMRDRLRTHWAGLSDLLRMQPSKKRPDPQPPMSTVLSVDELTTLVASVFERHGVSPENARIVAGVVAAAERDGSRSHGLFRLPGYVSTLKSGWLDGHAVPVVSDAAPGLVAVDAANGFAQPALAAGAPMLREKARTQGIAALAIRNSHHFAALWPDVEPFAEEGFFALACVNARSRVAPWGARKKFFGTNPMAFACPRPGAPPLVWDQASSVVAQGEVLLAATQGHELAEGIGLDSAGNPTTDPKAVLDGGAMLPFGGHKGSAIAFLVEILSAALTGGRFGYEDESAAFPGALTTNAGECVILIDPSRTGGDNVGARLGGLFENLAATGVERLPGDPRYARRLKSLQEGIEIPDETYSMVQKFLKA